MNGPMTNDELYAAFYAANIDPGLTEEEEEDLAPGDGRRGKHGWGERDHRDPGLVT